MTWATTHCCNFAFSTGCGRNIPSSGHVAVVEVLPNIHSVGDVVDFVVQRLALADVVR